MLAGAQCKIDDQAVDSMPPMLLSIKRSSVGVTDFG
jgi:hypothetical protein